MKKKMFGGIAIILSYVVMACWLYIVKRELAEEIAGKDIMERI